SDVVYIDAEQALLQTNAGSHPLVGQVTFLDESPLHRHDAFYGLDLQTTIALKDSKGNVIATALPNSVGQFVLTAVPNTGSGQLVAACEAASIQNDLDFSQTAPVFPVLPNHRPEITRVFATYNGQETQRAPPGSTVQLTAVAADPDQDALHYYWAPSLSQGTFVSSDATNVEWTLPSWPGVHVMYVRVTDGHGGFATSRVRVSTIAERLFTGQVSDSDGVPVVDATVTISNAVGLTDSTGSFSLTLSNQAPPFVLKITKPGLLPLSRVFEDDSVGGKYTLYKPETFSIPTAAADISVTNSKGVELFIPSNSLTRLDGLPLAEPLTLWLTAIDPCDPLRESPVSAAANGPAGSAAFASLTTAHLQIRDATGADLSLAGPGAAATLALPVSSACHSNYPALPPTVGMWSYDLGAGVWNPGGSATLRQSAGGPSVYVGTVIALPPNGYTAMDPSGPYSTIYLTVDRTIALPYDVRVTGALNFTLTIYASPTAINFPPLVPIYFNVLSHRQAPGAWFSDPANPNAGFTGDNAKTVIFKVYTISPPAYNYSTVPMKLGFTVPMISQKVEQAEPFLTHNYGVGSAATAASYYAAIDPANQKTTLVNWKTVNGFNAGDEASAVYFNASDLGFGRQIHMRRKLGADSQTDTAFYVSNFDTVDHARAGVGLIATVAMDYAFDPAYPSLGRYTKFYAFDAGGNRVDRVNLDNHGDKFLPNLCLICHGGSHNVTGTPSTGWNVNGKFIPFDMESYTYSTLTAYKPAAQHNAFRIMNLAIRDNTSPTMAILALINGWYGPNGTGTFDKDYVPLTWQGAGDLSVYRDAVKVSCRACHTTRSIDFLNPSSVDSCGYNVCFYLTMPDAQRTFSILWGSKTSNVGNFGNPPNQPDILSSRYGANSWFACP
ncbi:MAG TPA: hypothetical protein VMC06_02915, partial [Opitutaceae bacterium]|nr:hypothetical protein [Opitutaceae bacterium]